MSTTGAIADGWTLIDRSNSVIAETNSFGRRQIPAKGYELTQDCWGPACAAPGQLHDKIRSVAASCAAWWLRVTAKASTFCLRRGDAAQPSGDGAEPRAVVVRAVAARALAAADGSLPRGSTRREEAVDPARETKLDP